MRRREYEAPQALAVELFERAEVLHLAGVSEAGEPVLRTLHGVVDEGWVWFHAAPAGEKSDLVGRPVVLQVEQVVARLPSFFFDAERACPATTLFRSAQVSGVLAPLNDEVRKARVLQRLMQKLQPVGGHQPITADASLYRAAVRGLLIAGVSLEGAVAKAKLAQNKSDVVRKRLLEQLWARGEPGDVLAIELIRRANPSTPTPGFLDGTEGVDLSVAPSRAMAAEAAALLAGEPWNRDLSEDVLAHAHLHSTAWVVAADAGRVVGTARAVTDFTKEAWIFDVCVASSHRRRGVGRRLMQLLIEHPAVRRCNRVRLQTTTAPDFYRALGFEEHRPSPGFRLAQT